MQTAIRTLLSALLVAACSGDKKDAPAAEPEPTEPKPIPVAPIDAAAPAPAPDPAATAPDAAPATAPAPVPDPASDPGATGPTNLKVLPKNWSTRRVKKYMKDRVAKGLGVKCKECHDTDDFAKDGNEHKDTAREMIEMQNDLNRRFFDGKSRISCLTCHHGSMEPPGE